MITMKALTVLLLITFSIAAFAEEATSIRLSQAYAQLPTITVYLEITDALGKPARNIKAEDLTATVGKYQATVTSIRPFQESGEGVAYILLVDVSKSLQTNEFVKVQEALQNWIDGMHEKDKAAIISFGSEIKLVQDFIADKTKLKTIVNSLSPTDNYTRLHRGLVEAMTLVRRTDPNIPKRRVIVILSDGEDDFPGGMTKEEVLNKMAEDRLPIYAIGFMRQPRTKEKGQYLKNLGEFARTSGGVYLEAGTDPFPEMFDALYKKIRQVFIAKIKCNSCKADGNIYYLNINLSSASSDGINIRLISQADRKHLPVWYFIIGGVIIAGIIIGIFMGFRIKNRKSMREKDKTISIEPNVSSEITGTPVIEHGIKINLTVIGDKKKVYNFNLVDRVIIGRSKEGCDVLILDDDEISGQHCELVRKNDGVSINDLVSTNGTFVNGVPITRPYQLEDGDKILLGRTEFRFSYSIN